MIYNLQFYLYNIVGTWDMEFQNKLSKPLKVETVSSIISIEILDKKNVYEYLNFNTIIVKSIPNRI